MKTSYSLICLFFSTLLLVAGCSDEKLPLNNSSEFPTFLVLGNVAMNDGYLTGGVAFWDLTATGQNIDSILVGNARTMDEFDDYYYVADDQYWYADFFYIDSGYSSGDTINIRFFNGADMAELDMPLMEELTDTIYLTSVVPDTIPINSPLEFFWSSLVLADFYSIYFSTSFVDSLGVDQFKNYSFAVIDTSFVIPAKILSNNANYYLYVDPVIGPVPSSEGAVPFNVSSATMRGQIWSISYGLSEFGVVGAGYGGMPPAGINKQPEAIKRLRNLKNIQY